MRQNWYDIDAKDNKVSIQWVGTMSDGSNLSIYFDRYDERVRGIEDPKWSDGDLRRLLPSPDEGGLELNDTTWKMLVLVQSGLNSMKEVKFLQFTDRMIPIV